MNLFTLLKQKFKKKILLWHLKGKTIFIALPPPKKKMLFYANLQENDRVVLFFFFLGGGTRETYP